MKKHTVILFIFILASTFFYLQNKLPYEKIKPAYSQNISERYNDTVNLEAVRRISKIEGVEMVAVMNRYKKVLAGVRLNDNFENKNEIYFQCRQILSSLFSNAEKYKISIDDDNAEKIIELSYYLESDMKKQLLIKRFDFLMTA